MLTIASVGLHVLALLLDEYIGLSPRQVLVPFTSEYRPVAVALGILALYGLIAVYGSFYIKSWIGHRGWRAIHYGTFGVFALASYHGILSGTDTGKPWMLGLYLGAVVSVLGLLIYRFVRVAEPDSAGRTEPRPTPSPRLSLHGSLTTFDSAEAAESSSRRPAPEPDLTSSR